MQQVRELLSNLSDKYKINQISGSSFWDLLFKVILRGQTYTVSPLSTSTPKEILRFSTGLSQQSKDFFCPYPWDKVEKAIPLLQELIDHNISRRDLGYLLYYGNEPVF